MEKKKKPTISESIENVKSYIVYYKSKNETAKVKILEKVLDRLLSEKEKTKTSS